MDVKWKYKVMGYPSVFLTISASNSDYKSIYFIIFPNKAPWSISKVVQIVFF
jgi:hypothetical protein